MHTLFTNIRDRKPNPFDHLVTAVILLAGILIGLETDPGLRARHGQLFASFDLALLLFFSFEIILKIAIEGRRPWRYFLDPEQVAEDRARGCRPRAAWIDAWHCFDFTIVALCLLPHLLPVHMHSEFLPLVRIARILRLLRLAEEIPKLHLLVNALLKSLPSITYICIFLLMHFYSYAVAGTFLFGAADRDHFGSVGGSMLTLFEVVTGNGFSALMRDAMARATAAGYASTTPVIYYTTFVIIGVTIILNLFVGVIISEMAVMQKALDERQRALCDALAVKAAAERGEPTGATADLAALQTQLKAMQDLVTRIRARS
jgi:voltage-gated sodium channel